MASKPIKVVLTADIARYVEMMRRAQRRLGEADGHP